MEPQTHREQTRQLAEDLGWLEDHCRKNPDLSVHTAHLRLAAALTRNVIGPAIDGQPTKPLYIAVVGGAGAGKSTVVNFLAGAVVADANPQAGYTRHPSAFVPQAVRSSWPSYLGFLGPLHRLAEDKPAHLDEDVYQVKPLPIQENNPLDEFVIWDCPDMTTWASEHYVSRLMEVVALADVVVYVASDERYNDEVPTQFLHLLVKTGKAVVCCLTKVREADAPAMIEHFRTEILGKLPTPTGEIPPIPIVCIPNIPLVVRNTPLSPEAAQYRIPLLNQILALCPNADITRTRTLSNAMLYLESAGDGLLNVARRDLSEYDNWRLLVSRGREEFEERYRQEYLAGEAFRRFDKTREQVMAMIELPGPGRIISTALSVLRMPYEYAREFVGKTLTRPPSSNLSESAVCSAGMSAWLDMIQAESLRRSATHPLWKQITHGIDAGLKTKTMDIFHQHLRELELKEADDLDQVARAVPEKLTQNPFLLNGIRVGAVTLDLITIGAILWLTWVPSWYHFLLIPLGVALTRHGLEAIVGATINAGRNRVRAKREALLHEHLSGPVARWLGDWPSSGGSTLEKLQLILHRVPELIRAIAPIMRKQSPTSPVN